MVTQGQPAAFDSKSFADPDTPMTVHQWSGPGGQTSTRQRFVVDTTNLKPSTYPVTLLVRDRQQGQDRDKATLVVEARPRDDVNTDTLPPVARIDRVILEVRQGEPARFSSTSYHPDRNGKITRSLWQTSWGQRAVGDHIAIDTRRLNPGEYNVELNVFDDNGATDSARANLVVVEVKAPIPPVAIISPDYSRVNHGVPVRFFSKSYHPDRKRKIIRAQWQTSWGQRAVGDYIDIDTGRLNPGEHRIVLEVIDNSNARDAANAALQVIEAPRRAIPPVARIMPRRHKVQQGEWADFDGRSSTDPDGKIRTWTWSLNDKRIDRQPSARFDTRRLEPGEYRVGLEVTDEQQLTARDEALLIVAERPQYFDAALVGLEVSPAEAAPNEEVRIRAIVANRGKDRLRDILVTLETGGGAQIEEKTLSSLASGETSEVAARWIPKSAGEQTVVAAVDPNNQLPETNEENNSSRRSVVVLAPPALKIDPSPLEVSQGDRANFIGRITFPGRQKHTVDKFFWRGPGN
ncbi:MAG: PKD domain-containing protein, partial [Candidatus Binatia bacterium]